MKLIVGLGNPEEKYNNTRHNAGFMVMDEIARQCNASITQTKFKAWIAQVNIKGEKVILMKPTTYMNLSGDAVQACMAFYHIAPQDLCVIYDDMDLPCGAIRLREKGSAGGHNGMKSIIANVNTQEFPRIRMGIDKNKLYDTVDYVLGHFSKEELDLLKPAIENAAKAALEFAGGRRFGDVMNAYNKKK